MVETYRNYIRTFVLSIVLTNKKEHPFNSILRL